MPKPNQAYMVDASNNAEKVEQRVSIAPAAKPILHMGALTERNGCGVEK